MILVPFAKLHLELFARSMSEQKYVAHHFESSIFVHYSYIL